MLLFCLLALLPLVFGNDAPVLNCGRIPPSMWCKDNKIAEKCGLVEKCAMYKKESSKQKIQLTVFFKGLCGGCQEFITGPLYNDIYIKFSDYVDIELVPYGNAARLKDGTIRCEHGPEQCDIDLYEGCAIHFISNPVPFIACLEQKITVHENLEKSAKFCYSEMHISSATRDQIQNCVKTQLGKDLQIEAAKRRESIYPDKVDFVPWVLINNVSLSNIQYVTDSIPQLICDSIFDKKLPAICE